MAFYLNEPMVAKIKHKYKDVYVIFLIEEKKQTKGENNFFIWRRVDCDTYINSNNLGFIVSLFLYMFPMDANHDPLT